MLKYILIILNNFKKINIFQIKTPSLTLPPGEREYYFVLLLSPLGGKVGIGGFLSPQKTSQFPPQDFQNSKLVFT